MGGLTHTTIECMLGNVHHSMNHGLLPEFESQQRLNAVVQVQLLLQKAVRHALLQRKRYPDTINGTKDARDVVAGARIAASTNRSVDNWLL